MPNAPFERLFYSLHIMSNPEVLPTTRPDGEWNFAINRVRDNLSMFANLRGGRVHSSPFVIKSRSARLKDEPERTTLYVYQRHLPCIPAIDGHDLVQTFPDDYGSHAVASSIGAGWAPATRLALRPSTYGSINGEPDSLLS